MRAPSRGRTNPALAALFLGTFVMGSAELPAWANSFLQPPAVEEPAIEAALGD